IPTRSVGTISVISSTPIMPMLVLSVMPESCCDHGVCIQPGTLCVPLGLATPITQADDSVQAPGRGAF
ncbi:hypothetical protein, partial [Pseudomonas viridiflava]|uniref:hypothetical protein n=1 Tax=Pseudomonas viridiflava TaxID=33069 RepID=UPI002B1E60DD